jgi:prevent-host-death family protein
MVSVNIRELVHNFSKYLKEVKEGEQILVMERNVPVAELIPHNPNLKKPGWKREIKRIKVKGETFSETVVRMRREEQR